MTASPRISAAGRAPLVTRQPPRSSASSQVTTLGPPFFQVVNQ